MEVEIVMEIHNEKYNFWDVKPHSAVEIQISGASSCLAFSSTLKMEAVYYSDTSVYVYQSIRCYTPEWSTLRNHCCENLKSKEAHIH